jgi:hypothetical protein
MAEEQGLMADNQGGQQGNRAAGFLGSLKEALAAASREETDKLMGARAVAALARPEAPPPLPAAESADRKAQIALPAPAGGEAARAEPIAALSAEAAARASRGVVTLRQGGRHVEADAPPTTRVVRAAPAKPADDPARTRLVRGRPKPERGTFEQDPVVGWLVVVGGPGLGAFRPVFEGNNTLGRSSTQRIPIDFGDDSISSEEQAYIRYDSTDRSFLFVPNLAKTNVVSINDKRPAGAVELSQMDVITVGRTQLVFVPFCGPEFDWSELTERKE